MAGHRGFKTTAECGAVDRGHHHFRAVFNLVQDLRQPRLLDRLVELGDISTGNKRATGADEHGALGVGVRRELREGGGEASAHRQGQRIYRGIVDGDDRDTAFAAV